MSDFKLSIIEVIDNDILSLRQRIEYIIDSNSDFKQNIQLILLDLGSSDGSYEVAQEFKDEYPENIVLLQDKEKYEGMGHYYNLALDYATGEWVHFFDNDGELPLNAFSAAREYIEKYHDEVDIVSFPVKFYRGRVKAHVPKIEYSNEEIIDLTEYFDHSSIHLGASFVKSDAIDSRFSEELMDCEDTLFLTEVLLKKDKYALVKDVYFETLPPYKYDQEFYTKDYVNNKFELFFNHLITQSHGNVLNYVQYIFANELTQIIRIVDLNSIYDTEQEIEGFWNQLYSIIDTLELEYLEVNAEMPRIVRSFIVYLKNDDFHIELKPQKNRVFVKSGDYLINSLYFHKIRMDIVEIDGDTLKLSGSLSSNCDDRYLSVKLIREFSNGKKEEFIGKYVEYPTTKRAKQTYLGITWEFPYNFDFKIPLRDNERSLMDIKLVYHEDGNELEMDNQIQFREFAGLSFYGNYLIKDDRICYFRGRTFHIEPYSYKTMVKLELKSLRRILKAREPFLGQAIFYRLLYLVLYPFWRNRIIWLFIDRDTFADDNAEHLFKYCIEQDDGIEKYFILNRDSPDFERLGKDYDIVPFGSFKHKIKYLFSEKIMISQVTRGILNPFTHENSYNYEGLDTYKFCFLQHGVTKDDISWWIKKYHKNLYMFLTVSDLERDSMVNGHYNYEEDRIPVLGFPRYDNLSDDSKKEILFMPTWRRNLDTPEEIINSDFLKSINSFLNNEKLNEAAEEMGYTLVFRPHPELWKFLDFFDLDHVKLSEGPYQEMFKTASVMITDYSSVAFDFAYLKKPVIYYQDGNYHYGEGYYDYETMGFGKVIFDEDELVDKVIDYMKNDCTMEDEYKERVDLFFKFTDRNNCKRVYEWMLEH